MSFFHCVWGCLIISHGSIPIMKSLNFEDSKLENEAKMDFRLLPDVGRMSLKT